MPKKGLTLEGCVNRAEKYIQEQGECLLVYDVKNSRSYGKYLNSLLGNIVDDLNSKFDQFFPESGLDLISGTRKGFTIYRGDSGSAAIDQAEVIPMIHKYLSEVHPYMQFYWTVAKSWRDKKAFKELS